MKELLDDPTASLSESGEVNAQLVPDESGFYSRVVLTSGERERVKMYLKLMLAKMNEDYGPIWAKREQNKRAYEGLPEKGEAITIPFCRSMTNQQHAWLVNTVFSKDPVVTVKPLGDSKFTIDVQGQGGVQSKVVSGTDYTRSIERLIQHKWTVRLPMRKVLREFAMEGLQDGTTPALLKIIHEDSSYRVTERAAPYFEKDEFGQEKKNERGQKIQIINSPAFRTVTGDETVQIINVPGEDFMMPMGETNIQKSPIVALRTAPKTGEIRRKISTGKYDFGLPAGEEPPDEMVESVLFASRDYSDAKPKRASKAARSLDKRNEVNPLAEHIVQEVYFRWPLLLDDSGVAELTELVGEYHEESGELLCLYVLHQWNGKRPLVDWFMRQRPNSYSGTCTVEDIAPFQRYISQLFHLQVQNMVMRNVSVFFARRNSPSAQYLKGRKLRPGMVVEFDEADEVKSQPLGTPIDSIANEIAFLKGGAQEMALVTQYDNATADLSRVTAGAFQQQQDLAKMQPELVYQTFCEAISELALMYVQTLIQYAPEQKLPDFGEETNAVIDNVLHFPREMITDELAFAVTATAREDTKEAEFQRDLQLTQQVSTANMQTMGILGQIMAPGTPPQFVEIGLKAIERGERMLENLFATTRYDASAFAMNPDELRQQLMSLMAMQQMMQQQQQQMGGMGGQPTDAGPGGPVPSGAGGPESGGVPAPQPGVQDVPPQGAGPNL